MPAAPAPPPDSAPASDRGASICARLALLAAAGWLLSRVFVGLDFSDEMQYYGEIAALTRTGKFFQDDLFVQQLGYFLVLPLFKLHALAFPDHTGLVLFGRVVIVAAYAGVGVVLWRATERLGGFSRAARLAALAVFAAWIPFQILALSYNSMAYLLLVVIVARWTTRRQRPFAWHAAVLSLLMAMLTAIYPLAGLAAIALASGEAAARDRLRRGAALLGLAGLWGLALGGGMWLWHGPGFVGELLASLQFSRSFSVGQAILDPPQAAGALMLAAVGALFVARVRRGEPFARPLGPTAAPLLRGSTLGLLVLTGELLCVLAQSWRAGYAPAAAFAALLMLVAASVAPGRGGLLTRAVLGAGIAVLLALHLRWATGYFATAAVLSLLLFLAATARADNAGPLTELALAAFGLGAAFSITSANALHNFGVGAAAVTPFLALHAAARLETLAATRVSPLLRRAAVPALAGLLVLNGAAYPYREQPVGAGFECVTTVPAFAGLWTAPEKVRAIERVQHLAPGGLRTGERLLVAGPHPWIYFALGGEPATPMFFMHFTGGDTAHAMLAERLFRRGEPAVILIANPTPPLIHARLVQWIDRGCVARKIELPASVTRRYNELTRQDIAGELLLLRRPSAPP